MLGPWWKLLRQEGETGGEGGALRLHSSANRGIFVRFLFENKTLPTTPDASKRWGYGERGMTEGCDALSGLASFVYTVYVYLRRMP